jgi:hypothetical protein
LLRKVSGSSQGFLELGDEKIVRKAMFFLKDVGMTEWSESSDGLTPSSEGNVNPPETENLEVWESGNCEIFMDQGREGNRKEEMFF